MIDYWPAFLAIFTSALFREMSEHSKDSKWPEDWNVNWWNTNRSWKNKHNMKPNWLFKGILVFVTDGEHLFQWLANICIVLSVAFLIGFNWFTLILYICLTAGHGVADKLLTKNK